MNQSGLVMFVSRTIRLLQGVFLRAGPRDTGLVRGWF